MPNPDDLILTIFVADDDPTLPALIRAHHLTAPYRVTHHTRQENLFEKISEIKPCVILLDSDLPESDPKELIRKIRANDELKLIPVFVLTGKPQINHLVPLFQAGASDYIQKPVLMDELANRITTRIENATLKHKIARLESEAEAKALEKAESMLYQDRLQSFSTLIGSLEAQVHKPASLISGNVQLLRDFWEVLEDVVKSAMHTRVQNKKELLFIYQNMMDVVNDIGRGVQSFYTLVENLRPVQQAKLHERTVLALPACVDDVILSSQHLLPGHIRLHMEIHDAILVQGDATLLRLAMTHMIKNAVDALKDQAQGRIELIMEPDASTAQFAVRDDGPGVDPNHLTQIWDPFFTTKPIGEATGLGLSICRSIIEAHQGKVEGINRPEGGFECRFTLPLYTKESSSHESRIATSSSSH